ncbi:hypothetical protein [uncultured virus]|uniref:Uncharacterized protein n=1 Tax=uncultured virus TaxID=340016 RepID=A0A5Q0TWC9_9VIRU|nr:hypothetical protein [uncultured virus]
MRVIVVENLLEEAKKQYEADLTKFKDMPFIHARMTFYFALYYAIENYLIESMKTEDYKGYLEHRFRNGYLKYWKGRVLFRYKDKEALLKDDLHDVMEKLGLNKLAKHIEKEIRLKTNTLTDPLDKPNNAGYNNTHENP